MRCLGVGLGLHGLHAFINPVRKYALDGELWQGRARVGMRKLALERFDGSEDSSFFLYFRDITGSSAFIARVHAGTVAVPAEYVTFKVGKQRLKVRYDDLLTALGALA